MADTKISWTGKTWNPVPGYEGYSVTTDGRIRGPRGREMAPMVASSGHRYVLTRRPGVPRKLFLHRAILMAYVGPPGPDQQGRHLNDDPSDNRLENLAWGTRQDNVDDRVRNGGQPLGERSGTAVLTEADVRELRRRWPAETLRALAAEYGVSHTAVRRAINGTKWGHVA